MSKAAERVAALSPEKRLLVELMRRQRPGESGAQGPDGAIPKLPPFSLVAEADRGKLPPGLDDAYPLARMQAGMIFHMELTPDYPLYLNVDSWHLRARFVADRFQEAVQRAVSRHAVLRTSFDLGSFSEPLQLVHRSAVLDVGVDDLRGIEPLEQAAILERFVDAEKRRHFDLSKPPLLRFHIHIRSDDSFQFTLTEFHPILDGWSLQSTLTDIVRDYSVLLRGETPEAEPPLAAEFRDFVYLEQQALRSEAAQRFWREKLRGITVLLLPRWPGVGSVPQDKPFQKSQIPLPPERFAGLRELSRRLGVPLKSLFLAAHAKVLGNATGLRDVVTGLIVHGRPEGPDGDKVRGLFLNTAPLRLDLSGGSWEDLVRRAFEAERELLPFRRFPFAEIKNLSGRQDLLETALNVTHFHVTENVARTDFSVSALAGSRELEETSFALLATFGIDPSGRNLQLILQSDRSRVADEQTAQIADRFAAVLAAMSLRPADRHDASDLLTDSERRALLSEWPEALSPETAIVSLTARIEAQARAAPDTVAIVFVGRSLTYGELWRRAGGLAARLLRAGCGAESRIGVMLERSLELVVAIVGVLRAGGAYVPLDPSYPADRLAFLLEDAGIAAVIADGPSAAGPGVPVIRPNEAYGSAEMDADGAESAGIETALPDTAIEPRRAAYVIYTSGSTGKPKGVVVTHANVSRLFDATDGWFRFGRGDVWSMFHSFAFDFSVWEIFGALLYGGRLVIVSKFVARATADFHRLLAEERVTFLNQTPSAFRQLQAIELSAPAYELALREVVFGGEALDLASLGPWVARTAGRGPRLVNMYGITETCVHVTYRPLATEDLGARSLIGGPIPDLSIYLLDAAGNLAPIGVPAEIHVGGQGLARGYLGRPDLAAERFVPDPFAHLPGARLYRSGDLARRLPDGELEYLGRSDQQVKVRGFRIEPGEIEAALRSYPDVLGALAVVRREELGEDRLIAYVETALEGPELSEPLRSHLRRLLPEHMIPALIVPLRAFVLTAHGKIDRSALPSPNWGRNEIGTAYEAPRSVIEEILAESWSVVLRVDRVGVRDNFFSLGGDSIRILQVLTKARQQGLRLELHQFYEHETLGDLAAAVAERLQAEEAEGFASEFGTASGAGDDGPLTEPFDLVSDEDRRRLPEGIEDAYPLTRMQVGMIVHMDLEPDLPLYHNVDTMHLRAQFVEEPFRKAIARVVRRHAVLRTSIQLRGFSEPLQLVHREATAQIGIADVSDLPVEEQEAVVHGYFEDERRNRFDLSRPPLLRFQIHRRGESFCQFTLTLFHPILDGWSLGATLAEIVAIYSDLVRGETPVEPPPTALTFRDYVYLERRALEDEGSRRFWVDSLAGATALRLPRWPGASGPSSPRRIGEAILPLNRRLLSLRQLARSLGVPIKSVVLAAHCKVLAATCGEDDVITGLGVHGRPEGSGGEEVRGLFVNTLPLRLSVAVASWSDLVRAAFAAERALVPHRRFPLAEIQRAWGQETLLETGVNFTHFHVMRSEEERSGTGLVARVGGRGHYETNFPFSVNFGVDPWGTQLLATLAADLREIGTQQLASLARRYEAVMEALAGDAEADPREFALLTAAERQQLLREWNDPPGEPPASLLVHELWGRQASGRPDAVALVAEGIFLTYGELDRRSDGLADRLRAMGVASDRVVALCAERTPELVEVVLAVVKAGGAYLPLDPAMPVERLQGIVADAGSRWVVGDSPSRLEAIRGEALAVSIDELVSCVEGATVTADVSRAPSAENLCYVIYTSGSTGSPKGTLLTHECLAFAATGLAPLLRLGPDKRMLLFSSFAFDGAVAEIWIALLAGSELHFASGRELLSTKGLPTLLAEREITSAILPPSVLIAVRPPDLPALEVVTAVGEACPESVVATWGAGRRFQNGYGPTEVTIGCSLAHEPLTTGRPTIGRPLPHRTVHVVDRELRQVLPAAPGELVVGGIGLARGYLLRPGTTAERFVPDPFSSVPGARLYRTGDLGRVLPMTGELDFLGRIDRQVKIRGFRVELEEIEAALLRYPAVGEAAVIVRTDRPGEVRLIAYLSPSEPAAEEGRGAPVPSLAISEVRAFLREAVPEYMVPNLWVKLDAMPHSVAGKIDRRALPPPPSGREEGSSFLPPRNDLERRLAVILCEELEVEQVGVEDNIFDLGGHSLTMIRLHGRLCDLGFEMSITHLFQYASVASLAEFLSGGSLGAAADEGEARADQRRSATDLREEMRQKRRRTRVSGDAGEQEEVDG